MLTDFRHQQLCYIDDAEAKRMVAAETHEQLQCKLRPDGGRRSMLGRATAHVRSPRAGSRGFARRLDSSRAEWIRLRTDGEGCHAEADVAL